MKMTFVLVLIFGCGAWDLHAELITSFVIPSQTDPTISDLYGNHYVAINSTVPKRGRLFLLIPDKNRMPGLYKLILHTAANSGMHAIGLAYVNQGKITEPCQFPTNSDAGCLEKIRLEQLFGDQDYSEHTAIGRENSQEYRLLKLLTYLSAVKPLEGWEDFFTGEAIQWTLIQGAGHGLGAGGVVLIGQRKSIDRVLCFAGPGDLFYYDSLNFNTAPWILKPTATGIEKFYGFIHSEDHIGNKDGGVDSCWSGLGMGNKTGEINVDSGLPPDSSYHRLVTAVATSNPYQSVVMDQETPKNGQGTPAFTEVWRFMMGISGSTSTGNEPPVITDFSPLEDTLVLDSDTVVHFSIIAVDPDPDNFLSYIWYLDGVRLSDQNPFLELNTQDLNEGLHTLLAEVSDGKESVQHLWIIVDKTGKPVKQIDLTPPDPEFYFYLTPHPFSEYLEINFDLPHSAAVRIMIYDLEGRVKKEINRSYFQQGFHRLRTSTEFRSGVYFVQITVNQEVYHHKVLKLK